MFIFVTRLTTFLNVQINKEKKKFKLLRLNFKTKTSLGKFIYLFVYTECAVNFYIAIVYLYFKRKYTSEQKINLENYKLFISRKTKLFTASVYN